MAEIICPQCKAANKETAHYCSECGVSLLGLSPKPDETHISRPSPGTGFLLQERYRIDNELGRGGFGAVYEAWDTRLDKLAAVKENMETSLEAQRQFAREALVLASLSHPNLPRVTDHFSLPGQGQYLVMDYVEGKDLETQVRTQGVVPVEQALTWIIQVADALEYLHNQVPPVFHRDVKPANVRIATDGKAMLVDFGLVKVSAPNLKTTMGARAISPGYAPPEQYGQGRTDARTDIYGLSSTLYRLVTGCEPIESVQRISGDTLLTAEQANAELPKQLSQVIERGMALDPINRYQSIKEFKAALKELLAATRTTGAGRATLVVDSESQEKERRNITITGAPLVGNMVSGKSLPGLGQASGGATHTGFGQASGGATPSGLGQASGGATPSGLGQASGGVIPAAGRSVGGIPGGKGILAKLGLVKVFPRWLLFFGIGGVSMFMLLVIVVSVIALVFGSDANKKEQTEVQNTMVVQVKATSTQMAQESINIQASPTFQGQEMQSTAVIVSGVNPQAPAVVAPVGGIVTPPGSRSGVVMATPQESLQTANQAAISFLASLGVNATPELIYGPESGSLTHYPTNGSFEGKCTSIQVKNFMLQTLFSVPFSDSNGMWDFGLMFRMYDNGDLRVVMNHDKGWEYIHHKREPEEYKTIEEGNVRKLGVNKGDTNLLQFTAMDEVGWLYVNNVKAAKLDLSGDANSGAVCIAIGFFNNTEVAGEATPYTNFTVWELR
jgi:serine/threonine-protein kinase